MDSALLANSCPKCKSEMIETSQEVKIIHDTDGKIARANSKMWKCPSCNDLYFKCEDADFSQG